MIEIVLNENGDMKAILNGEWHDSYYNEILENNVQELELNSAKGWKGDNLSFFKTLQEIKRLTIIDLEIKSVDNVHYLENLEQLKLITYAKTPIDFNCFNNLKSCVFEWIEGSENLAKCKNLTSLNINRLPHIDDSIFIDFLKLDELTILNSRIQSLKYIYTLSSLRFLKLAQFKNLVNIDGIRHLAKLIKFEMYGCKKVSDVTEIFKLKELEYLALINMGDINTIKGIERLENLNTLLFYESSNVLDGNLFPITKLGKLNKASFQNRQHYTHKKSDFY